MKIALVSAYDIAVPSGVNAHVQHLAAEFRARGHTVRVVAPGPPGVAREAEVTPLGRAFPFPSGGSRARVTISPWLGPHVKRLLARERFDVVHLHEPLISALTLLTLRYAQSPTVGTFHAARETGGSRGYALLAPLLRPWVRRLNGRIAVSPAAARLAARYFPGTYEVIPNGIDVARFAAPASCPIALQGERPAILFVGRFEPRKGLDVLLEAFARLKPRHPALRLVVVGDGPRRPAYERWVAERAVPDVSFVGRVSGAELPAYYQHATVYCAPNTGNESFGIVLLEAMAAGCPVVASSIAGFAAVLTHEAHGLLTPPRDPAALAAALDRLLGDAALAARYTAAARSHVEQYDWPTVADRVLAYYGRLLSQSS
jgi:phosphatidylinositol alpha-mannosyltransferase